MPIRRKSSILKKHYEEIGQEIFFGHDNIQFKTINLSKKQRLKDFCLKFRLKKFKNCRSILLDVIIIN